MGEVVPEHVHAVADQGPPPRRAAHGTGERLQVQLKLHTAELVELAPAQLARQDGDEVDVAPPETEATHRRGAHEVEASTCRGNTRSTASRWRPTARSTSPASMTEASHNRADAVPIPGPLA